jgi:hypothetical protein
MDLVFRNMKKIVLIITFLFIFTSLANAQNSVSITSEHSVDTNFIYKITEHPVIRRGYVFPVTLECNGKETRVIVDNGYFFQCLKKKYNFTQKEYITYIRDILINDKVIPYCIEEQIDNNKGYIYLEKIVYYDNPYIKEYQNDIEKFLKWSFDKNHHLKKNKFRGMIVEVLFKNNIAVAFGCESFAYFYE